MAKKAAAAAPKKPASGKAPTKSEIYAGIAETTGLTRKQVGEVFEALTEQVTKNIGKKGPGQFTVPGLMKIVVQKKAAQPPRQVRNPATGEMVMSKAKPARNVVKVRALKGLKEMVE